MNAVKMNTTLAHDNGYFGKQFEVAIHELLKRSDTKVRRAGRVDERIDGKNYEIKTGAGELGNMGEKIVRGVSMVIYAPLPIQGYDPSTGNINLEKIEGFVLTREAFITALEEANAIREKTSSAGVRKVTIQTFWNNKQNKPHGALYGRILDAMYEHCEMTLEEFLEAR